MTKMDEMRVGMRTDNEDGRWNWMMMIKDCGIVANGNHGWLRFHVIPSLGIQSPTVPT